MKLNIIYRSYVYIDFLLKLTDTIMQIYCCNVVYFISDLFDSITLGMKKVLFNTRALCCTVKSIHKINSYLFNDRIRVLNLSQLIYSSFIVLPHCYNPIVFLNEKYFFVFLLLR